MRRILIILFTFHFSLLTSTAQTKLTAEQQKEIIEKVNKSAMAASSMQCDFSQTKKMKLLSKEMQSKGVMYFKRPNQLRWQYTAPYDYTFILNGDKVQLKSTKSTKNIDVQGNKMFRQISDIILNSVTGGSLKSSADFSVEVYKSAEGYFARMYPKKKELKQIYQAIEIYFNPSLTLISSVKMIEKTGDVTTVKLTNTKTNIPLDEKLFKVN